MPFSDSRSGPGTLLVGTAPGTEYGFQVTSIVVTPAVDSTDGVPTLADPEPPPQTSTTYSLDFTAINDYLNPDGLQRFAFENDGVEMDFVYTPLTSGTTPATLTGRVTVRSFPMGGDVAVQVTTDASWPITGKPVWAGGDIPVTAATAGGKRKG